MKANDRAPIAVTLSCLLAGCANASAHLQGHWAESQLACASDASFVIEGDRLRGEGGETRLQFRNGALTSSDGLLDVRDVSVEGEHLEWTISETAERFTYVRCPERSDGADGYVSPQERWAKSPRASASDASLVIEDDRLRGEGRKLKFAAATWP